jgi:hypothetical protein
MSDHRCLIGGSRCPGHPTTWQLCVDPAWGTPYEHHRRALLARQAVEMNELRTRQAQALLALAHRFREGLDYAAYQQRLRGLLEKRDRISA